MIAFILSFGLIVFSITAFAGELPIESPESPSIQNDYKLCIDDDDYNDGKIKLERCKTLPAEKLPNFGSTNRKIIDGMRPVLLKFFEQIERKYDPKVDQLLQNLIDAVIRNGEFVARPDNNIEYYLQSSIKNLQAKRYLANWLARTNDAEYSSYYPSNKTDFESKNVLLGTSKRYLGALARSGWLPRNFNLRSSASSSQEYENRAPTAFDRVRLLRTMDIRNTPAHYYRGGRGPATFRMPSRSVTRLNSPRHEPIGAENRRCSCK